MTFVLPIIFVFNILYSLDQGAFFWYSLFFISCFHNFPVGMKDNEDNDYDKADKG